MFMPGIKLNSAWARDVLVCINKNNPGTLGGKPNQTRVTGEK